LFFLFANIFTQEWQVNSEGSKNFWRENRNGGIEQKMKQRGERNCLFPESMAAAGNTNKLKKLKKLYKPSLPGPSKGNWAAANLPAYPTSSTSSAPKPPALSFDPAPVPRLAAPGRAL
jgi:hypothetical protein